MSIKRARLLRTRSTDAERRLWARLRKNQISDCKSRRQAPIGPYIVDFVCYLPKIVIEVDGSQHAWKEGSTSDAKRDQWLRSEGFSVLRFWNSDVHSNIDGVLTRIQEEIIKKRRT